MKPFWEKGMESSFFVVCVLLGKLGSEYAYFTSIYSGYHIMIPQILNDY